MNHSKDHGAFKKGTTIWVYSKSNFIRECIIKEVNLQKSQIKIHYISFTKHWDEWLSMDDSRINFERPHVQLQIGDNISFYAIKFGYKSWIEAEIENIKVDRAGKRMVKVRLVTPPGSSNADKEPTHWMPHDHPYISIKHKPFDDPEPQIQYANAQQISNLNIVSQQNLNESAMNRQKSEPLEMVYAEDDEDEKDIEPPQEPIPQPPEHGNMHSQQLSVGTESDPSLDGGVDGVKKEKEQEKDEKKTKQKKYERKMKKLAGKGKGKLDQQFLAMAGSGRYVEFNGLQDFLQSMMDPPPEKELIKAFFDFLGPNQYLSVTFTAFQKALNTYSTEDGKCDDVIVAFQKFEAEQKPKKSSKTKRQKSKRKSVKSPH